MEGYCVDKSITEAISNFPTATNRTDFCAFFGLVNQLSASTSIIVGLLAPLRHLLSTKKEFTWPLELDPWPSQQPNSPSRHPPHSPFLTLASPHACVLMPVGKALDSCCNRKLETRGPLFRQDPDFSLTQNLATPSLSWNYSQYHGP